MSDEMTFDEYQKRAHATAVYDPAFGQTYTVLGMVSEVGEIAALLKRAIRDGIPQSDLEARVLYELGDVLWYLGECASTFGWKLSTVAQANLDKLADRASRGVIRGEGGDR